MVPMKTLPLEKEADNDRENAEGNHFLNDFQLHECKRSSVPHEPNAVGRYGKAIFDEGDAP